MSSKKNKEVIAKKNNNKKAVTVKKKIINKKNDNKKNKLNDNKGKEINKEEPKKVISYTKEKKNEMLEGYLLINKKKWYTIPLDSHIRYIRNDGKFVAGGFVKRKWEKEDKKFFLLGKSLYDNNRTWVTELSKLKTIYKKVNEQAKMEISMLKNSILDLNKKVNKNNANLNKKMEEIVDIMNFMKSELIKDNEAKNKGISRENRDEFIKINNEMRKIRMENLYLKNKNDELNKALKKNSNVIVSLTKYVSKKLK